MYICDYLHPLKPARFCILLVLISFVSNVEAQIKFAVSGSLKDAVTGLPLFGATVFVPERNEGAAADDRGYYRISLPEGSYTLIASLVGYEIQTIKISVNAQLKQDFILWPVATQMDEVIISGKRPEDNLTNTESGMVSISRKEMEKLPFLMGEIDPLRVIQLMPGVHTAGEGNTGFYVRGGAVDQNLVLLDNSVVYNPSHLFGFFSVFNGNTIEGLDLYKGGIPAYYGGRLSSITKINTRRGSIERLQGEAGVGLLSTNLLLEGPIQKGKGSFLVAARRTYIDLFIDPVRELFSVEEKLNYYFFDVNVNADYQLAKRDHIQLRAFSGKDNFSFGTGSSFSNRIQWQNSTASLAWIHTFSENLFATMSLNAVRYDMNFNAGINNYSFSIFSDITDHGFNYQLEWNKNKHNIVGGVEFTRHRLSPNNVDASSGDAELTFNNNVVLFADESSVFINDKISFTEDVELSVGLRYTMFNQRGPFTRYITDESFQVLDTLRYQSGDRIATYGNFEPRISLRYSLDKQSSLKVSFDHGYQYLHMAPLSSASLPMDVWVTSSSVVKPQSADQYSAGYFRNSKDQSIETSAVVYYKDMRNQLEYRDGVIIGYSKGFNYDDNFVFGRGRSYGIELMAKKNRGKVNGMVAYTLARTTRSFPELNDGKPFSAKYDRLHDLSVVANYDYNKKWTFSSVFVYGTGNALNLPIARYVIQGSVVNEYGPRNAFRMPAYHRLDLSATYTRKKSERYESQWIFSVYNIYNRRNPYYIYFETDGDLSNYSLQTSLNQVSLFPVLPSVTYRIKF